MRNSVNEIAFQGRNLRLRIILIIRQNKMCINPKNNFRDEQFERKQRIEVLVNQTLGRQVELKQLA